MVNGGRSILRLVGVSSALVGLSCDEEIGPPEFATASVSGRITLAGEPLSGGWLEFLPVDGTVGRLRSAPIDSQGRFRAKRVAVGVNGLRVVGVALPPEDRQRFGQAYLMRRAVPASGLEAIEIDLIEERARIQARMRAQTEAQALADPTPSRSGTGS